MTIPVSIKQQGPDNNITGYILERSHDKLVSEYDSRTFERWGKDSWTIKWFLKSILRYDTYIDLFVKECKIKNNIAPTPLKIDSDGTISTKYDDVNTYSKWAEFILKEKFGLGLDNERIFAN